MDMKWIDRAYQFDEDPSGGGGGEPAPEPSPEPTPEPTPEPSPEPSPDPGGEPTPEPTPTHVNMPEGLGGLFEPAPPAAGPPAPAWTPPGPSIGDRLPAKPPPKTDFPDGDDWIADPGKAAQQQAAAIAYSNWESQQPLHQAIGELRQGFDGIKDNDFEAISNRVMATIDETGKAVKSLYMEKGRLNSDAEFRNNPELQKSVENSVGACVSSAIQKADRTGDTKALERIARDPRFPYRCLALAKADAKNVPEGALRPGASPAGPQPPQASANKGLSAGDAAALKSARAEGLTLTAADIIRARKVTKESIY